MNDSLLIKPPESLARIEALSAGLNFAMASEPRTGALLRALVASKPSGRFLELGTGTGVGTAWLLSGMDSEATLVSVDVNSEFQSVASKVHSHDSRLTLVIEDGAEFLRKQPARSFDLIFADAIPGKYEALEDALTLVKQGGFYVIDDMLPQVNWPEGHDKKVAALLNRLSIEKQFHVAPLQWSSGVVVLVRRSATA